VSNWFGAAGLPGGGVPRWAWIAGAAIAVAVALFAGGFHAIATFVLHNPWHIAVALIGALVGAAAMVWRPHGTLLTVSRSALSGMVALLLFHMFIGWRWFSADPHGLLMPALLALFGSLAVLPGQVFPRPRVRWLCVAGIALVIVLIGLWQGGLPGMRGLASFVAHNRWHIAVTLFGMAVGASELVGRYKDAPFLTMFTPAAAFYVTINGAASLFAYEAILEFQVFSDIKNREWIQALVAGFGSMAFFRSSLFTMKVGDTDVSVGPGIFFQVLLFATDRACDRRRAWRRSALVTSIMQGVSFEKARDALPSFCFELMQNLPSSEAVRVRQAVDGLASSDMGDAEQALNLGLILMNVVGSEVLASAVRRLGPRIHGPANIELEVLTKLRGVDFERAFPVLVEVAFVMSKFGTVDEQTLARATVMAEIEPLRNRKELDNDAKVMMLALSLQQKVGDAVLDAALTQLGNSIKAPTPPRQPEPPPVEPPVAPIAGAPAEPPPAPPQGAEDRG